MVRCDPPGERPVPLGDRGAPDPAPGSVLLLQQGDRIRAVRGRGPLRMARQPRPVPGLQTLGFALVDARMRDLPHRHPAHLRAVHHPARHRAASVPGQRRGDRRRGFAFLMLSGGKITEVWTALAIRHFKHKQGQDDGGAELEPKHPAVKFVLGAWNEGDFSAADKHIAPGIEIYTNGLSLSSDHGGPAMAKESIESWRALAPDLRMELSQEIGDKHRIAIEFRITGTHTGDAPELPASGGAIDVEGTAFLTLSGGKSPRSGRSSIRSPSRSRREPPRRPPGGRGAARASAALMLVRLPAVLAAPGQKIRSQPRYRYRCRDHGGSWCGTEPLCGVRMKVSAWWRNCGQSSCGGGAGTPGRWPGTCTRSGRSPRAAT